MLSVILLSILIILLSTQSVIRHLIWQELEMAIELESGLLQVFWSVWTGKQSGQLISLLEKLNCFFFVFFLTGLITLVPLMWKWMDLFLKKNDLLRCYGCLSLLNWIGALLNIISTAQTASMKIRALIYSIKFFSPEVVPYLCKYTIQPFHGTLSSCLDRCS